jgi:hypothetical protein
MGDRGRSFGVRVRRLAVGPIRAYRALASPWLPAACRFEPTCSRFAIEAVERHGVLRGAALAVRRILRCHPLGGWGYDPVPGSREEERRSH